MSNPSTSIAETFLIWWSKNILRFPWLLLLGFVSLCAFSLYYTSEHLGVNTDTSELLSKDLPFQKNRFRWENEFPQDSNAILFVVEAATAEYTTIAAHSLFKHLQESPHYFSSVYIPSDNPFFRQQGFLYLEQQELDDIAAKLIDAQPFIGHLAENYSLAGLLEILGKALDGSDDDLPLEIDPILDAIDQSLVAATHSENHYLSWQKLLSVTASGNDPLRKIVSAKPKLDFNALLPAEEAINHAREIARTVQTQIPDVVIRITGEKALEQEEMQSLSEDTTVAAIVSLVLVCICLLVALRSIRLILSTLITLLIGLTLTAGFAAATIGHLNVLSVSFAVIFIGLGVDFAIHICLRYRECREQDMSNNAAITDSISTIGFSLFLCALTTSIGFFAFVPTEYAGVSELGFISGGGMFIGFFVSLTLLPALLKIFAIKHPRHIDLINLPIALCTFPFRHAVLIRVVSILLAFGASFLLTKVSFDSNPLDLRDPNTESVSTFKDLLQSSSESPFMLIGLRNDLQSANQLARKLDKLPSVKQTITLSSLVAKNQDEKMATIDDLNLVLGTDLTRFKQPLKHTDTRLALLTLKTKIGQALSTGTAGISIKLLTKLQRDISLFVSFADQTATPPNNYAKLDHSILDLLPYTMQQLSNSLAAYPFGLEDIPAYIKNNWLSANGVYKIVIDPAKDLNSAVNLQEFAKQVQAVDATVTGLPVADLASGKAVIKAFIEAFSGALIMIILILLIILRSIGKTLLVIWPLLLAALLTAAINVLLDNPFNFANIIVMPLLMGMGVDSGIHIMHRLHTGLAADEHLLQTSTAKGVFFSSLTTLCSFTSLAFTAHRGIASMGLLLVVGISLTLICSLIVLPAFSKKRIPL